MKTFKKTFKFICERCGKLSRTGKGYCEKCKVHAFRKVMKDDFDNYTDVDRRIAETVKIKPVKVSEEVRKDRYRRIKIMEEAILRTPDGSLKDKMIQEKEDLQVEAKISGLSAKRLKILPAIKKNYEEYKKLLERKKKGESVEDLITKNRYTEEILKKETNENSEEAIKIVQSGGLRRIYEKILERGPPKLRSDAFARARNIESVNRSLITAINRKFKENEEEYEKLLERKNKGNYVDDLISQNRYTAKDLEQKKKFSEEVLKKLKKMRKNNIS